MTTTCLNKRPSFQYFTLFLYFDNKTLKLVSDVPYFSIYTVKSAAFVCKTRVIQPFRTKTCSSKIYCLIKNMQWSRFLWHDFLFLLSTKLMVKSPNNQRFFKISVKICLLILSKNHWWRIRRGFATQPSVKTCYIIQRYYVGYFVSTLCHKTTSLRWTWQIK